MINVAIGTNSRLGWIGLRRSPAPSCYHTFPYSCKYSVITERRPCARGCNHHVLDWETASLVLQHYSSARRHHHGLLRDSYCVASRIESLVWLWLWQLRTYNRLDLICICLSSNTRHLGNNAFINIFIDIGMDLRWTPISKHEIKHPLSLDRLVYTTVECNLPYRLRPSPRRQHPPPEIGAGKQST